MARTDSRLAALDQWTSSLFYLAAGLMTVVAGLFTVEIVMDQDLNTLLGIFAPGGFGVAFLGALGLYTNLRDRSPWIARIGVLGLAIGLVASLTLVLGYLTVITGVIGVAPEWLPAANLPLLVGVIVGLGAVGVGVVRTGTQSPIVGWLLLWPPIVFGILLIVVGTFILGVTYPHWIHVVHNISEVVVYLAIGTLVKTGAHPSEHSQSQADPAP